MKATRLVLAAFGALALMASVAPAHAQWRGHGGPGFHDRGWRGPVGRGPVWRGPGWRGPAWPGYYRPYYARPYVYAVPPPVYYYPPAW